MNLNKIIIMGRITFLKEMAKTTAGKDIKRFSVATNKSWIDKNGDKKEEAVFHNIVCFGHCAKFIDQYGEKGKVVLVEGELKNKSYEVNGEKKFSTEILAENVQLSK